MSKYKQLALSSEVISSINTYVNEMQSDLIARAFALRRTVDYVTPMLNVANISALNLLTIAPILQTDSCTWNDSGSVTFTQRNMQVYPKKTNNTICIEKLKTTWMQHQMKPGSHNEEIPFAQFIMDTLVKEVGDLIEAAYWNGTSAPVGVIPLLSSLSGSGEVVVSTDTGSFTVSTIDERVNALITTYASASADAYENASVIYMNSGDLVMLKQNYQIANLFVPVQGDSETVIIPMFPQITAVGFKYIPTGKMFIANPTNVFYGTDLLSDETVVDAWYEKKDDAILMRTKFKLGGQVAFPAQIVKNWL